MLELDILTLTPQSMIHTAEGDKQFPGMALGVSLCKSVWKLRKEWKKSKLMKDEKIRKD